MPAMIRRTILLLSVLAAGATAAAWVASYKNRSVYLHRNYSDSGSLMIFCTRGQLRMSHWLSTPTLTTSRLKAGELLGFGYRFEANNTPVNTANQLSRVCMPLWFPLFLLLAYPTWAFIRGPLRTWGRIKEGLCLRCGYDLTGNVSGICPECGTKVEQS